MFPPPHLLGMAEFPSTLDQRILEGHDPFVQGTIHYAAQSTITTQTGTTIPYATRHDNNFLASVWKYLLENHADYAIRLAEQTESQMNKILGGREAPFIKIIAPNKADQMRITAQERGKALLFKHLVRASQTNSEIALSAEFARPIIEDLSISPPLEYLPDVIDGLLPPDQVAALTGIYVIPDAYRLNEQEHLSNLFTQPN